MQKLQITLVRPEQTLNNFARIAWSKASPEIARWMKSDLINAMVYGGLGIQGIAQTDFYKFITSDDGLSQLGIDKSEPPKLLQAYATNAFSISSSSNSVELEFGILAALKVATPHPAAGTGYLQIVSWLEWITDPITVGKGYVPRAKIPSKAQNNIRLSSPLGGLMLSRGALGSAGTWSFPYQYINYSDKWFGENVNKIQSALIDKSFMIFKDKLING
jgi:hypothetical protein